MGHVVVPAAEALLDKEIRVLDKGFVRLVDYMGGDARIVQAARVSYSRGTKSVRDDGALIDYLMRHQHTSPFEHVVIELHCKLPIFVARQWIRHRTARINEISGRYSVLADEFYLPPASQIRRQSRDNKQGRDPEELPPEVQREVLDLLLQEQQAAYETYQLLLHRGVARELARINLPLSVYTQWYWQMDLHNLFHFLELRLDPHAQWEIREYAKAIARIAQAVAPLAYAAFERHVLNGRRFSSDEVAVLREMVAGRENPLSGAALREFEAKLGLTHPPPSEEPPRTAPPPRRPSRSAGTDESRTPAAEVPTSPPPTPKISGKWPSHLSDEEINQLPLRWFEGTIRVIERDEDLPEALNTLTDARVLGFDTESRPAFRPGESYPISLIQLATAEEVFLVRPAKLSDLAALWRLFESDKIIKAGVALQQDLRKLAELHPLKPAGFVDIATLAARMGFRKTGTRGLAAAVLGFRVSKGVQRSNWGRSELTAAQIRYAATDAWVARALYLALTSAETPAPQPPSSPS